MSDQGRVEAEGFDQTNGVVDGLQGESDGTADGDLDSDADQERAVMPRPVGAQDTFRDDWYGDADGRDQNP